MRRILVLNRYFYPDESATSQILSDLAFALAEEGHEVVVLASRQRIDDPAAALAARERHRGVGIRRLWTTTFGRGWLPGRAVDYLSFYLSATWRMLWEMRRGDVVVAKTDPPLIGILAAAVAALKGARLVHWWQDVYPEIATQLGVPGAGLMTPPLKALRGWACRRAVINVTVGRCMSERLLAGTRPFPTRVIPNWTDDDAIRPLPRENHPLREEWGLAGRFVVGYSGNMGRGHEFDALLGAAAALSADEHIAFLFIGEGARRDAVAARVAQMGLRNVHFRPFQPRERLPLSLTAPDLHVVSLRESLAGLIVPSKFYGALAAGRPVLFLGPDTSEVARAIAERGCGMILSDAESADIAAAVAALAANEPRWCDEAARARAAIDEAFGKQRALSAWREVIARASG